MAGGAGATSATAVDFAAVFRAIPTPYLVMTPDLVIVDANPAYLANVVREREDIVGRPVFEAFPPVGGGAGPQRGLVDPAVVREGADDRPPGRHADPEVRRARRGDRWPAGALLVADQRAGARSRRGRWR